MSKSGNLEDFWKVCFRYTFLRNLIVVLILSRSEFLWKRLPESLCSSLKCTPVSQRLQYDLFNISAPFWSCKM